MVLAGQHGSLLVSTVASQQGGPEFDHWVDQEHLSV